jgi:hypothetical protein
MTPGTRLLEACRELVRLDGGGSTLGDVLGATYALKGVRALYSAAHAIGERVSVVYPPGEVGIDFVGVVIAVEFSESKVYYRVRPDDVAEGWLPVDSAFVHPAPEPGCIVGARIGAYAGMALAELRMHEWSVDVGVEQNRCPACRAETKAGHRAGCLLHEAINARLAEVGAAPDPPPRTLPLYRAPGVSGGPDWTVEDVVVGEPSSEADAVAFVPLDRRMTWTNPPTVPVIESPHTTGAFLINTASPVVQQAAMEAIASASPSWFPMDGRTAHPRVAAQMHDMAVATGRVPAAEPPTLPFDPRAHIANHDILRPCPDCGTTPSQPHQSGCPTGSRSW